MKRVVLFVISGLIAPAICYGGLFQADFNNGLNSEYWSVNQNTGIYTVDDTQGDIRLEKTGNAQAGMNLVEIELNLSKVSLIGDTIPGDFEALINFSQAVLPGPGLDQVELHAAFDDDSYFFNVRDNDSGTHNVHVWDGQKKGGFPTSAAAGTLRIVRQADVITALFDDSVVYQKNFTAADLNLLSFTLQNNLGSNDSTSVIFDDFKLSGDFVVPEPASIFLIFSAGLAGLRSKK
ncbi:hypothetical protein L21SP3_01871 [Sedimentisphaera cyanobacteriorum]|uniref:PEP-CTERM protein-sorting domain-containing protein n=1 Tax=Sedimentisphaera cyanobacteriorum TaxID=1940790 RepID=A0A1Q2HRH0_9BACT|nr:hypothetical protein [Sedimentisphaera cyanobacteriorum]AQQ10047.1 hypothetical protein L21SP3_01871 [Sedimentisphaera cyanobacteriorum]